MIFFKVLEELNALEASDDKSLIVRSALASPPRDEPSPPRDEPAKEPAPSQANEAAELIVVSRRAKTAKSAAVNAKQPKRYRKRPTDHQRRK